MINDDEVEGDDADENQELWAVERSSKCGRRKRVGIICISEWAVLTSEDTT